ncbi:MAG: GNAT family N-acetyltransferase [Marinobacterium sp.]|nr:GNAT family N-acetyltransferase [Marinobacterium sp.]
MTELHLRHATDKTFSQQLTRENMAPYYRQHNILWNQQRFDENWQRYQNYELCLSDQPVAIVRLSFDGSLCYIRELQVQRAWQGNGIGGRLLDWVLRRAREQQYEAVRLSVYTNNPARRLYARKGFQVKQLYQGMYRMQHRLSQNAISL